MEKAKKENVGEIIIYILIAVFLVLFVFGGIEAHSGGSEIFELPGGWQVQNGDKTILNVSLEEMDDVFKDVRRKESFFLTHPLSIKSHDPLILRIYSRLSALRVLVDGRQIYSYGIQEVEDHKMVGSGYHFVLLPSSFYEKELKIELIPSEDNAIHSAPEIIFTSADGAISIYSRDRMFGIFSGLFLFVAGIFLVILSVLAIYIDRRFYPLAIIGVFSCTAGLWCLATIKALQLFSGNVTLNSILEYLAMYFLPVPALFLSRHFRQSASPRIRKFIAFMTCIAAVFFLSAFVLQVSGIMNVTNLTRFFHFFLVPVILTLLFAGSSKWRRMKPSERMYQMGMFLVLFMIILELSIYYVVNLFNKFSLQLNTIITPFASMVLIVVMAIGFLLEIYDMRLKDTERERLQKLAFRDQMTDLMNRVMCERRFEELKNEKASYFMLDMDLNGLKTVNDAHGHQMGDRYIMLFSGIIIKAFGDDRNIYRVGGDEFLYIDSDITEAEMKKKIDFIRKLEKIIGREENIPFDIDASFGMAWSGEVDSGDPEDVYRLADRRMYEMKKSLKKERE